MDELAKPIYELVGLMKCDQAAVDDVWTVAGALVFGATGDSI